MSSSDVSSSRPFYAGLAQAYDALVTDPVGPWVEAVHQRLVEGGRGSGRVLDAGCGTGRHAAALADLGHAVDLLDASADLLSQAAARCPSATVHRADLCGFDTGSRYDAVTCRGVLNDLVDGRERQAALDCMAAALVPGGVLFLDVREASAARLRADREPHTKVVELPTGELLRFTSTTTWDDGLLRVDEKYDVTAASGARAVETYDFAMRPWTVIELRSRLDAAGLARVVVESGVGRCTPDRLFVTAVRGACWS